VNFAPVVLNVPDGVEVRKVDLAVELQVLAFHEQRRKTPADGVVTNLEPPIPTPHAARTSKAMNA